MGKLFAFNAPQKPLTIKAKTEETAEITLYASIGESFWEDSVSAKSFSEELKKLPSTIKNLNIRINSPGGSVFDGMTIYERLKQYKAKKTVYIDGMAASIASVIALAGDEIIIGEGAMMMIHKPWAFVAGNAIEMEKTIELLDKIESQMIGIYARKTGLSQSEISKMLMDDFWMTADEAVDLGFATKISEPASQLKMAACFMEKADWFRNKPKIDAHTKEAKNKIDNLKNSIEGFLARK